MHTGLSEEICIRWIGCVSSDISECIFWNRFVFKFNIRWTRPGTSETSDPFFSKCFQSCTRECQLRGLIWRIISTWLNNNSIKPHRIEHNQLYCRWTFWCYILIQKLHIQNGKIKRTNTFAHRLLNVFCNKYTFRALYHSLVVDYTSPEWNVCQSWLLECCRYTFLWAQNS